MASGRFCYLDGVDFAINPLFQIEDLTKNNSLIDYGLNLALKYDLSKAKTIVNCKYEYENEKNTLGEELGAVARALDNGDVGVPRSRSKSTRKKSMSNSISDENAHTTARNMETIERIKQDIDYHGLDDDNQTKISRKKNGHLKSNNDNNNNNNNDGQNQLEFSTNSKRNKNHTSKNNQTSTSPSSNKHTAIIPSSFSGQDTQTTHSNISSNGMDIYAKQALSQTVVAPVASSPRLYMLGNFSNLLEPTKKSAYDTAPQTAAAAAPSNDDINNNNNRINNINSKSSTSARPSNDLINFDLATRSSLDPFHDMELKTINDLEELKNILENQQQQQQQAQRQASAEVDNFGLPKISFVDLDLNKS